jgi:hypothetical protein
MVPTEIEPVYPVVVRRDRKRIASNLVVGDREHQAGPSDWLSVQARIALVFLRPLDNSCLLLRAEMLGVVNRHGDDGFAHFYLEENVRGLEVWRRELV